MFSNIGDLCVHGKFVSPHVLFVGAIFDFVYLPLFVRRSLYPLGLQCICDTFFLGHLHFFPFLFILLRISVLNF
jgi:hypothetical protein